MRDHITIRRALVALAPIPLYAGLVVWLTWPLASHAATHLPRICANDALYDIWVLVWDSRALLTDPTGIFDPPIYYPSRHVLFYGNNGFGALPYFAPIFLATGNPVLATNVTFIVCMTLAAWGLHRVTTHWTGSELAGFVAAWTLLTGPRWTFTIATWPTQVAIHYVPWIAALAAAPVRSNRTVAVLTGLLVLQSLVNPVYVAASVVAPVALVAVARGLRRRTRASGGRLFVALILAGAILSPMYAGYRSARSETLSQVDRGPHHRKKPASSTVRESAVPETRDMPLVLPWQTTILAPVMQTSLILIVIGGVGAALRPRMLDPRARVGWCHAGLWTTVGLFLGWPAVVFFGELEVRTPLWALAGRLGPFPGIATLWRLDLSMVMGLALLAGVAFAVCERLVGGARLARTALGLAVTTAMYLELRAGMLREGFYTRRDTDRGASYALNEAPRPDTPLVRALQQERGPVLELPMNTFGQAAAIVFRSIDHRRPLLNGTSSYWPPKYLERTALAAALPDPQALAELQRVTGVTSIVVHPNARSRSEWDLVAERGGRSDLRFVARIGDSLLFEATLPR